MDTINLSKITTYQAGATQASMHRALQKISDRVLKPFGITKMHWMIIGNIIDAGAAGIRISDLASKLGTTIAYLTTALNLLESKGFVKRTANTQDSRSKIITINPLYADNCQQIEAALRQALRQTIYSAVTPAEFETYIRVMYKLNAAAKRTLAD